MPPIMLPCEPVLGARIDHDVERLAQILQRAEQLGAVNEKHVVIRHAVHHQEFALEILGVREH